jgi:hypothetical protein
MINMKISGSQNDRVERCLDLLKDYISQLPVILQQSTPDSTPFLILSQMFLMGEGGSRGPYTSILMFRLTMGVGRFSRCRINTNANFLSLPLHQAR